MDSMTKDAVTNCFRMIALAAGAALEKPGLISTADTIEMISGQLECVKELLSMDSEEDPQ